MHIVGPRYVYGSGVGEVNIIYHSEKTNTNVDTLSQNPHLSVPHEGIGEYEL